jgi:4-hydroxy-3-polyprenylbenzoate decarboxylase
LKYLPNHHAGVRFVLAITGSSGIPYGTRLLEAFQGESVLVVSDTAKGMLEMEAGTTYEELASKANHVFDDGDLFAPIASGSCRFDGMVIVPCSVSTLSKVASGIADTLITRAASVCLKEGRQLILVPRETPVTEIILENQLRLARAGAMILPASPGFYHQPKELDDMVDFVVGKILDQIGQDHDLYKRWGGLD